MICFFSHKKRSSPDTLKDRLKSVFAMKNLEPVEHILGVRIKRDKQQWQLYVVQIHLKVLKRSNMNYAKALSVHLQPHVKLGKKTLPK